MPDPSHLFWGHFTGELFWESIDDKNSFDPNVFCTSYDFDWSGVWSGRKCVASEWFAIGDYSLKFSRALFFSSNKICDK